MDDQKFPPFTQVAMASLALIIAGGIYLSANLPEQVALGPAVVLLALSALLMAYNLFSLTRVEGFAWDRFFAVAKWSLLAYLVIGGMIEYVFLRNHTRGEELGLLSWGLALFVLEVPVVLAFTVARYQQPD